MRVMYVWPCPGWEISELSSLKGHSLILRPILHKLAAVIFRQQFKTFDSNTFTLSSLFSSLISFLVRNGSDHNFLF